MKNRFDIPIDWDDLRVFLAVATSGTLSGAARSLNVSVATAGRRIDRLEDGLGMRLFHRHATGLTLSEDAEPLVERAERVLDGVVSFLREAESGEQEISGSVTVNTLNTIMERVLAPQLWRVRSAHPKLAMTIRAESRIVPLSSRLTDLALRVVRPTEERVIAQKVGEVHYGVFASSDYLTRHGFPEDPSQDLSGHEIITYEERFGSLPEAVWVNERCRPEDVGIRLPTVASIHSAVAGGCGIGILPRGIDDGLVCIHSGPDLPVRDLWLAVHEDARDIPRIEVVWEFLKQVAHEWTEQMRDEE